MKKVIESKLRAFYFSCMAATGDLELMEKEVNLELIQKNESINNQ